MTFEGVSAQGIVYDLGQPVSVRMNRDADAPADDMTADFPLQTLPVLYRLYVKEGEALLFAGIVDEQEYRVTPKGNFFRITARSMAALLLDNQAIPQTYYSPPFSSVFARHAAPYGITQYRVPSQQGKIGEFTVARGMSEWQVLEEFCRRAWGEVPRIDSNQVLTVGQLEQVMPVVFCNENGGVPFLSLYQRQKNYEKISEVMAQLGKSGGYQPVAEDVQAMREGIWRRRCVGMSSLTSPQMLLQTARGKAEEWVVTVPGWPQLFLNGSAKLVHPVLGSFAELKIWEICCTLDVQGMRSTVTLRRR